MRIIVCGGRDYEDTDQMWIVLRQYDDRDPIIVHGGARGADRLAAYCAEELLYRVERHPAEWDEYGKAAGPIRNEEMAQAGADLLIAFPGGRGTADMVRRARSHLIPVRVIT